MKSIVSARSMWLLFTLAQANSSCILKKQSKTVSAQSANKSNTQANSLGRTASYSCALLDTETDRDTGIGLALLSFKNGHIDPFQSQISMPARGLEFTRYSESGSYRIVGVGETLSERGVTRIQAVKESGATIKLEMEPTWEKEFYATVQFRQKKFIGIASEHQLKCVFKENLELSPEIEDMSVRKLTCTDSSSQVSVGTLVFRGKNFDPNQSEFSLTGIKQSGASTLKQEATEKFKAISYFFHMNELEVQAIAEQQLLNSSDPTHRQLSFRLEARENLITGEMIYSPSFRRSENVVSIVNCIPSAL